MDIAEDDGSAWSARTEADCLIAVEAGLKKMVMDIAEDDGWRGRLSNEADCLIAVEG